MSRYDLTDFKGRVIEPLLLNKPRGVLRVDDRRDAILAQPDIAGTNSEAPFSGGSRDTMSDLSGMSESDVRNEYSASPPDIRHFAFATRST